MWSPPNNYHNVMKITLIVLGCICVLCLMVYLMVLLGEFNHQYMIKYILPPKVETAIRIFVEEIRSKEYEEFSQKELFKSGEKQYNIWKEKLQEDYTLEMYITGFWRAYCRLCFDDNYELQIIMRPKYGILFKHFKIVDIWQRYRFQGRVLLQTARLNHI